MTRFTEAVINKIEIIGARLETVARALANYEKLRGFANRLRAQDVASLRRFGDPSWRIVACDIYK